eukprot:365969-Hanusia_phi.AAC.1
MYGCGSRTTEEAVKSIERQIKIRHSNIRLCHCSSTGTRVQGALGCHGAAGAGSESLKRYQQGVCANCLFTFDSCPAAKSSPSVLLHQGATRGRRNGGLVQRRWLHV